MHSQVPLAHRDSREHYTHAHAPCHPSQQGAQTVHPAKLLPPGPLPIPCSGPAGPGPGAPSWSWHQPLPYSSTLCHNDMHISGHRAGAEGLTGTRLWPLLWKVSPCGAIPALLDSSPAPSLHPQQPGCFSPAGDPHSLPWSCTSIPISWSQESRGPSVLPCGPGERRSMQLRAGRVGAEVSHRAGPAGQGLPWTCPHLR